MGPRERAHGRLAGLRCLDGGRLAAAHPPTAAGLYGRLSGLWTAAAVRTRRATRDARGGPVAPAALVGHSRDHEPDPIDRVASRAARASDGRALSPAAGPRRPPRL